MIKQLFSLFKKSDVAPTQLLRVSDSPAEVAASYIRNILLHSFGGSVSVDNSDENVIHLTILNASDNSRLIGKEGATIESVQLLTKAILHRTFKRGFRVIIDVGEFNPNREAFLLAHVEKALESMVDASSYHFPNMPSMDRRYIHLQFENHPLYETKSEGTGSQRHVVLLKRSI